MLGIEEQSMLLWDLTGALNFIHFVYCNCTAPVACRKNQNYNYSVFCRRRVLEKTSGIEEQGVLQWDLTLILLMCWIIVYFCIWKGPKSTGKVQNIKLKASVCKFNTY